MAWVRWRGHCAELLATVYENGRSRQRCLANLRGAYAVPEDIRQQVTTQYPQLRIDWAAIDAALAQGPPGAAPLTPDQQTWLTVETALRQWAHDATLGWPDERACRLRAANILTHWRANEPGGNVTR